MNEAHEVRFSWKRIISFTVLILLVAILAYELYSFLKPRFESSPKELVFHPGSIVKISGYLKAGGKPIANVYIAIEVRDPEGNIVWVDQSRTDKNGYFTIKFKLRPDAKKGEYTVYVSSIVARMTIKFRVE